MSFSSFHHHPTASISCFLPSKMFPGPRFVFLLNKFLCLPSSETTCLSFKVFFPDPSIGHLTLGSYGKSGTKADGNLHDLLQILTHVEALYLLGLMSLFSIFQSHQWGIFRSLSLSLCYYLDHHTILYLALTTSAYLLQDNPWILSYPPRKFMIISPCQYP